MDVLTKRVTVGGKWETNSGLSQWGFLSTMTTKVPLPPLNKVIVLTQTTIFP